MNGHVLFSKNLLALICLNAVNRSGRKVTLCRFKYWATFYIVVDINNMEADLPALVAGGLWACISPPVMMAHVINRGKPCHLLVYDIKDYCWL